MSFSEAYEVLKKQANDYLTNSINGLGGLNDFWKTDIGLLQALQNNDEDNAPQKMDVTAIFGLLPEKPRRLNAKSLKN